MRSVIRNNAPWISLIAACALRLSAVANIIPVTSTNDSGAGSLRQALAVANNGDTIDATGVSGVISLTSGALLVNKALTINGPGADVLAIDGNMASGVFEIVSGDMVAISGFTIRNGHGGTTGGGVDNQNNVPLTITNCIISGNSAGLGGGIFNSGPLTVTSTTISGNSATSGGATYNDGSGNLTVNESTFTGNTGNGSGGAIFNIGTYLISNTTVSRNSSSLGGGALNIGMLTVLNSTISNNMSDEGAAVYSSSFGTVTISNSTISGNTASEYAAGIFNLATLQIANTTFSNNSAPFVAGDVINLQNLQIGNTILNKGNAVRTIYSNSQGVVMSLGYNLSSDDGGEILTGPGDQVLTNPMLGPLQNNGGATFTHSLLPGSPAINAGDPNFTPPPLFDQRGAGFDRVVNGRIDVGSFELQGQGPTPTATPTPTASPTPSAIPSSTPTSTPLKHPQLLLHLLLQLNSHLQLRQLPRPQLQRNPVQVLRPDRLLCRECGLPRYREHSASTTCNLSTRFRSCDNAIALEPRMLLV